MGRTVISVDQVSKQYRLGKIGTGTLGNDLKRWWFNVRGKEDPFLKIGDINDRTKKGDSDFVWALHDISFEVQQGEVLGIIGSNGAGKSTLLKILSRVTAPTKGEVKMKGRIASLLEVGTGFHPDLSGRENIYLNGAILGMRKKEITAKFDEIVQFSGVERYIDTPVKRYSSGMYVRLAFAVAAHLESEILILDEVLAVGDVEFQKKCLGKMKDVAGQGRTVIFVSHNLSAVSSLCTRGVLLDNGKCVLIGDVERIVMEYLKNKNDQYVISGMSTNEIRVTEVVFKNRDGKEINSIFTFSEIEIEMICESDGDFSNVSASVCFDNHLEQRITSLWTAYVNKNFQVKKGKFALKFNVPNFRLAPGDYKLVTYIESNGREVQRIDNYRSINVAFPITGEYNNFPTGSQGLFIENFEIEIKQ